jgi:hypothetical protein
MALVKSQSAAYREHSTQLLHHRVFRIEYNNLKQIDGPSLETHKLCMSFYLREGTYIFVSWKNKIFASNSPINKGPALLALAVPAQKTIGHADFECLHVPLILIVSSISFFTISPFCDQAYALFRGKKL